MQVVGCLHLSKWCAIAQSECISSVSHVPHEYNTAMVNIQPHILWLVTALPTLMCLLHHGPYINSTCRHTFAKCEPCMAHVYIISQPRNSNGTYRTPKIGVGFLQCHTEGYLF